MGLGLGVGGWGFGGGTIPKRVRGLGFWRRHDPKEGSGVYEGVNTLMSFCITYTHCWSDVDENGYFALGIEQNN